MMKSIRACMVMMCLWVMVGGVLAADDDAQSEAETTQAPRVVAYYAGWNVYERGYFVRDIPAEKITHLVYAFANISEAGECVLGDPWAEIDRPVTNMQVDYQGTFRELVFLKEDYPHLKTLLAVGGWTWSGRFSDVALTPESRDTFAASCVAIMKKYGFDGLDIDWEFPGGGGLETNTERPEDPQNFTLLLETLREHLEAQSEQDGAEYLLTIAAPAPRTQYSQLELDKVAAALDWINLMLYDFAGGWSSKTDFQANLYPSPASTTGISGHESIQGYLEAGVPADQIVLGVPFYGRGWTGVPAEDAGFNQPYTGLAGDASYIHYRQILRYLDDETVLHWDDDAQAAWLYVKNNDDETGTMISYDDAQTMHAKAAYIRTHGLGGAMIWEIGQDDASSTLLNALFEGLNERSE